jgi:hypothetical protein
MTAEEFKEAFQRKGFLAPIMSAFAHNVRVTHADWFDLANHTSECLQAIAVRAVDEQGGKIGDKNVLSTLLLLRSLGLIQAIIMMLERAMVVEARVLMRTLLETSFCIASIHKDADAFVEKFREDHRRSQRDQAEIAIKLGSLDPNGEQYKALMATLDSISRKEQLLPIGAIAKDGPIASSYLLYKIISNDSAHCSVTSVLNHFNVESLRRKESGYILGPFGSDKIELNIDNLVHIATGIGVGFTNIVNDMDGNRAITVLCNRYDVLRAKATAPAS